MVTQFVFSVGLITATIIIGNQLRYIREKDLGFNKEYVFSFALRNELHDHFNAVRDELLKQPGVLGIAASDNSVVGVGNTTADTYWDGREKDHRIFSTPEQL